MTQTCFCTYSKLTATLHRNPPDKFEPGYNNQSNGSDMDKGGAQSATTVAQQCWASTHYCEVREVKKVWIHYKRTKGKFLRAIKLLFETTPIKSVAMGYRATFPALLRGGGKKKGKLFLPLPPPHLGMILKAPWTLAKGHITEHLPPFPVPPCSNNRPLARVSINLIFSLEETYNKGHRWERTVGKNSPFCVRLSGRRSLDRRRRLTRGGLSFGDFLDRLVEIRENFPNVTHDR